MKAFDVVEDIRPRFCPRAVLTPVDALPLQQTEETFRSRVVRAGSDSAHAASNLMPLQESLVLVTGELGEFNWSSQHLESGELRWVEASVGGPI